MPERKVSQPRPDGRVRAVIDAVRPCVDAGRFAVKRIEGDEVRIEADCFADGHDALCVMLRWRAEDAPQWQEVAMRPLGNDAWQGSFVAGAPGRYRYTVSAWVDHLLSWREEFAR
ncbi:MAG: maltotransferase domain-containing protein, partial [Burkholderiales bacterium]